MAAAVGTLGKMGIGASSPTDWAIDFKSESLKLRQERPDGNGVRGTRSRTVERTKAGLKRINGPLSFQPNAADLHRLLPWGFGTAAETISGTNKRYRLAEAAATRYVQIDRHAKVFTYSLVGVNTMTFRCEQGQILDVDLDCLASTETVGAAGTFPAIYTDITTNPFILSEVALTVGGTTVTAKSFEVGLDNKLDSDRFFNSNTLSAVVALDRMVTFKTLLPYGDFTALYDLGAATGVAVVITLTNGSVVMTMTMPKVTFPPISPNVPGRVEVMLELEGQAFRYGDPSDADKAEIIVTLDTGA